VVLNVGVVRTDACSRLVFFDRFVQAPGLAERESEIEISMDVIFGDLGSVTPKTYAIGPVSDLAACQKGTGDQKNPSRCGQGRRTSLPASQKIRHSPGGYNEQPN